MSDVYPATPLGSPGPAARAILATTAPELTAALAETRAVRDGYARLCEHFGPGAQSGMHARITFTQLARHREAAGLLPLPRSAATEREDITMRYRRERDEARAVVTEMIAAYRHLGSDRWASEITGSRLPAWHDSAGLDAP